ncbi:MAG: hypothetical protein KAI79_10955, partial [Bacteroidales bacterium]|nr:hypothetical protein [Bacteroidales bacterium]
HVKDPENRLLIVYKILDFNLNEIPLLLKTKQIATTPVQILKSIIKKTNIEQISFTNDFPEDNKDKQLNVWKLSDEKYCFNDYYSKIEWRHANTNLLELPIGIRNNNVISVHP